MASNSSSSTSTIYAMPTNSPTKGHNHSKGKQPHRSWYPLPIVNSESDTSYFQLEIQSPPPKHSLNSLSIPSSLNLNPKASDQHQAQTNSTNLQGETRNLLHSMSIPYFHSSTTFKTTQNHSQFSLNPQTEPKPNNSLESLKSSSSLSTNTNDTKIIDRKRQESQDSNKSFHTTSQGRSYLLQESENLIAGLNTIDNPSTQDCYYDNRTATIFDLRFQDRQRIADLISELANAQEQVELLESRLKYEQEGYHQNKNNQLKRIEELSDRCKFLVAQNASRMDITGNLSKHSQFEEQNTEMERNLKEEVDKNNVLKGQILSLELSNSSLQTRLAALKTKHNRCLEDNKRLKWILRTIQQREEILLTHNKCFSEESQTVNETTKQDKRQQTPATTTGPKPPFGCNISTSKASNTESFLFSRPYRSETTQTIKASNGFGLNLPSVPSSSISDPVNELITRAHHRQSGGDFHEFHVYEPHIVIPSMTSPVIMKIPKSPLSGLSSIKQMNNVNNRRNILEENIPSSTTASLYPLHSKSNKAQVLKQHHSQHQNQVPTETEYKEEDILRELFFTY